MAVTHGAAREAASRHMGFLRDFPRRSADTFDVLVAYFTRPLRGESLLLHVCVFCFCFQSWAAELCATGATNPDTSPGNAAKRDRWTARLLVAAAEEAVAAVAPVIVKTTVTSATEVDTWPATAKTRTDVTGNVCANLNSTPTVPQTDSDFCSFVHLMVMYRAHVAHAFWFTLVRTFTNMVNGYFWNICRDSEVTSVTEPRVFKWFWCLLKYYLYLKV